MNELSKLKKRVIRVIALAPNSEALNWSVQVRECLNRAGLSDPEHAKPESLLGPSASNTENIPTMLAFFSTEEVNTNVDVRNALFGLVSAFRVVNVPTANITGSGASLLNPGDVAVIIVNK